MDHMSQPKLSRRKFVQRSVSFRSVMPVGGNEIEYLFAGSVAGNSMSGTVELGEYGHAQWSATKETS